MPTRTCPPMATDSATERKWTFPPMAVTTQRLWGGDQRDVLAPEPLPAGCVITAEEAPAADGEGGDLGPERGQHAQPLLERQPRHGPARAEVQDHVRLRAAPLDHLPEDGDVRGGLAAGIAGVNVDNGRAP